MNCKPAPLTERDGDDSPELLTATLGPHRLLQELALPGTVLGSQHTHMSLQTCVPGLGVQLSPSRFRMWNGNAAARNHQCPSPPLWQPLGHMSHQERSTRGSDSRGDPHAAGTWVVHAGRVIAATLEGAWPPTGGWALSCVQREAPGAGGQEALPVAWGCRRRWERTVALA